MRTTLASAVAAVALIAAPLPADAAPKPVRYKNCAALNKVYRHGVGLSGARDKVTSGRPVTTFTRSKAVYLLNRHLDRDRDRIACEKR